MNPVQFESQIDSFKNNFSKEMYEHQMYNLTKNICLSSTVVDIPDDMANETKVKLGKEMETTICKLSETLVSDVIQSGDFGLDVAKAIEIPTNFKENIAKTSVEHIEMEFEARKTRLLALNERDEISLESAYDIISETMNKKHFTDTMIANNYKKSIEDIWSFEGKDIIESIKEEVIEEIEKTEKKNAIIRDAIDEVNTKKKEIESKINNEPTEDNDNEGAPQDDPTSSESFLRMDSFIQNMYTKTKFVDSEGLDLGDLSQEELNSIRQDYSVMDTSVDLDDVNNDSLSTSSGDDDTDPEEKIDDDEASVDDYDESNEITVDEEKFDYNDITPETLSEEAFAKELFPLSLNKFSMKKSKINVNRLATLMACTEDRGKAFFTSSRNRINSLENMLENEVNKDECDGVKEKLDKAINIVNDCEKLTDKLVNDMGILGILDGNYQLTENTAMNAVKHTISPTKTGMESINIDSNYKNCVEIFEILMEANSITSDLVNSVDILGDKTKLGDLEELINEKILDLPSDLQHDITDMIHSFKSLESVISVEDFKEIQNKVTVTPEKANKVELTKMSEIDSYGFSYIDLVDEIKKDITSKYSESELATLNVDVDTVINYVCEAMDITKIDMTNYEKIIVKLTQENNGVISNSMEGLFIRNKGKAILTTLVATDRLGLITESSRNQIMHNYLNV